MAVSEASQFGTISRADGERETRGSGPTLVDSRAVVESRLHCVSRLSSYVAHGLSNPLAYVLGNLALLERDLGAVLDGEGARRASRLREHLAVLREGIGRIGDVVNNLKALAHPDASERRPVDVGAVVDTSLSLVDALMRERATLDRRYGAGHFASGNEACLVHVFLAVLTHVAESLPPASGARVRLDIERRGSEVVVEIAHDAVLAPPERLEFPFAVDAQTEGRGLGLFLAAQLVAAQGGGVEYVPGRERGVTFRFYLPCAQSAPAPSSTPPPLEVTDKKPRVLVVDDEPNLARLLSWTLEGFEVEGVTEASLALAKLLGGEAYDAVLCDLHMPGLDGIDVYERVLAARPEIAARFLFVSGGAHTERARRFLDRVKPRLLEKPFSPHRVAEALRKVVRT